MASRIVKIVMAGDGGVGKTSLLEAYKGADISRVTMTIGVNLMSLKVDERLALQIWDLSGQEHYRFLVDVFFRGAKLAILVFDLSRPSSLTNLGNWARILKEGAGKPIPVIVVGNKKDLGKNVTDDAIKTTIKDLGLPIIKYFETSALTGEGVFELFDFLRNLFSSALHRTQ